MDENDIGYYLRATATYTDGEGEDKTAQAVSDEPVQMKDYSNNNPEFLDEDPDTDDDETQTALTRKVPENSPTGTAVGDPVVATDLGESGLQQVLTYSLKSTNTDADKFTIDTTDRDGKVIGQIRVASGAMLDSEHGGRVHRQRWLQPPTHPGRMTPSR